VLLAGVSPRAFLRVTQVTVVVVVLNIVTGAAVRLTDSGLGCPDWPTCSRHRLTPPLSFHPAVEFGNRLVVVVLCLATALALLGALRRVPRRRDLVWLSAGLLGGVLGEAVLGAVVVYTKLNPYVVMTHFMVGMALLAVAVVLTLRAGHRPGPGTRAVTPGAMGLARALVGLTVVVLAAGAATTGTGPHAGGKGAKRIPLGLEDMTRIHAEIVLAAGVVLLVLLWVLWKSDAPARIQGSGRALLAVMVVQGMIGYTQFFSHLPPVLVGLHVLGASTVWSAVLWFHHGLSDHLPELTGDTQPGDGPGVTTAEMAAMARDRPLRESV
jgi:cytochrome c oxidase assembly protein subunit 15